MKRPTHLSSSVRFGPFELDVRSAELQYNGHKTLLHQQPFQVLLALLERPGDLISREELVQRLWPDGTLVDYERGLNKAVNKLRDVLRDSADSPRFVETIPRRGYRFIAPLEGGNALTMASGSPVVVKAGRLHKTWLAMGVALMFGLMAAVSYGVYSFLSHKGPVPYENFTISQITNTGKAVAAAISPDGKFLLSVVDDHGKHSLWLRNILTDSDTQVMPSEDARYLGPAFSPDSNYIYFRKDVRLFDSVDILRSPVLGGSPQVVVRDVDTPFTFSPEGKHLAFVRANNPEVGKFQVLMAKADGTDEKMLSGGLSSAIPNAIAWSPDGKQIASAIPGLGDALGTIQIQDVVSARTQTLGRFNKEFVDLAWLPDGHGLLATYGSPAMGGSQVGFISYPGGQFRTVTKDTNSYQSLTLSADGKTLVTVQKKSSQTLYLMPAAGFAGQPPKPARAQNKESSHFGWASNGDLYFDGVLRISADGSKTTRLLSNPTGQITSPANCADGRYVLVEWAGRDGSNKVNIWRLDSNGSNPKQLTDGVLDVYARCSPDGAWVYFFDYKVVQIKRVQIDGGTPEIVPGTVIPNTGNLYATISPDGKLLAFTAVSPTPIAQIALVNLDAAAEPPRRMIVPNPRISGPPHFTPDGKAVVYQITEHGVANLWLQPLDGSRSRQITNFPSDRIAEFEFSPDGKTLGVLRCHTESDVVLLRDTGSSPQ